MKTQPDNADIQVGANIRMLRSRIRLSQTDLGARIGVTFQQIQKYEKGANRVSASKLVQIASALQVDVRSLFDGIGSSTETIEPISCVARDALALARDFDLIEDASVRQCIRGLVKSLRNRQVADAA